MPKKKKITTTDLIADIKNAIEPVSHGGNRIPDIITFCESPEYLGFSTKSNPIVLTDIQRIILKIFYRGSVGNEDLKITQEEINLCERLGLNDPEAERGMILDKYFSGNVFRELVLVWGRRSGKDFCASILALYEAMKLLEVKNGDPHAYYGIAAADINILTVANAQGQATIAFEEIREKLLSSKYFEDKYTNTGITSLSIRLLTTKDKADNKAFAERGLEAKTSGSINIEVGHSNSATLLGKGCFVLILDEVASYKTTGGVSSGDRIYSSLTPTISTYFRETPILDEHGKQILDLDGNPMTEKIIDGKIISISSPRGKEGKLWDLFSQCHLSPGTLACRLPTWEVMPARTEDLLRATYRTMAATDFDMEFGAIFSGLAGTNFFSEEHVNACFKGNMKFTGVGKPGHVYFIHLDPASTSHNYGLAVVHKEMFLNEETKQSDYVVVVDILRYWQPAPNKPVVSADIDAYVIELKKYFRVGMVTYDAWNSLESRLRLRKSGIAHKETRYTNRYKMIIYDELEQLVHSGKLIIPSDGPASELLRNEMIALQRKPIPTGYRIGPKTDGDGTKTDDLVDSLAGACYGAINKDINMLPLGRLVSTGVTPQASERMWQSMQGAIGYGTGEQVAKSLENRQPWKLVRPR